MYKCLERPGFEKGRNVPSPHKALEHLSKTEEELKEMSMASRNWIQSQMKEDAKK